MVFYQVLPLSWFIKAKSRILKLSLGSRLLPRSTTVLVHQRVQQDAIRQLYDDSEKRRDQVAEA